MVIRSDIGVLNDLLVERTHLSTEKINFDPGQRVFTMPVGDVRGRRQKAELIDRSLITVEGVRAMDVRDEARIVFYDIVHVMRRDHSHSPPTSLRRSSWDSTQLRVCGSRR
jgi:hypothetical protein